MQDTNPYLEQDVLSASPIKLRWMLITRAEELCTLTEFLWQDKKLDEARGWLLRIREILGELLSGVRDVTNPAGKDISDLYVFMLQLLTSAEQTQSTESLRQLKALLAIENETWHQVYETLDGTSTSNLNPGKSHLNFDKNPQQSGNSANISDLESNLPGASLSIEI